MNDEMTESILNHDPGAPPSLSSPPGMDYAFLRKTGIEHIQRLAGDLWTDHNTHDPGITLLECLCYAITDVSYRLSFSMEDILAAPSAQVNADLAGSHAPLFTARAILPCHPLTVNDYRKLLIDIPGVRNAWLKKAPTSSPPIYYDKASHRLSMKEPTASATPLPLIGLYHVFIAKDDTATDGKKEQALLERVKATLHQHRNIAEDFADPVLLPFEEITVKLQIVVADNVNLDHLAAQIYLKLSQAIAPTITFHSLTARRQGNRPIDAIFEGPPLTNGFIDEAELTSFGHETTLRSSDFIQILLDMEGVQSVKKIALGSTQASGLQPWVLALDPNYTPKLKPLPSMLEKEEIKFERQGILCGIDAEATKKRFNELKIDDKKAPSRQDIPLPRGRYRHLKDYTSLQHDLPPNYDIGQSGLPDSVSQARKIQAKQLKAYLLFFDQLLANYLAQLDHIKELFCPIAPGDNPTQSFQTYFTQLVTDIPEFDSLLNTRRTAYKTLLQDAIEETKTKITRGNTLLNHLLARFGEQFVDHSLLLYDRQQRRKPVMALGKQGTPDQRGFHLEDKLAFLHAYPQLSAARGSAFDYTKESWGTDNIAGLKRRLCGLLGIKAVNTARINDEGFHLVEHLLLRPQSAPSTEPYWAFLGSSISHFSKTSDHADRTCCHAPDHGLQKGDHITISNRGPTNTTHYNGRYEVKWVDKHLFHIEKPFVAEEADQSQWALTICGNDPYSLQLSIVLPDWPVRFQEKNFKKLLYDTLISEAPAHVVIYVHWFNWKVMRAFEEVYQAWLTEMATDPASAWQKSTQLLALLRMGKALTT